MNFRIKLMWSLFVAIILGLNGFGQGQINLTLTKCEVVTSSGNLNVRNLRGQITGKLQNGSIVYINQRTNDGRANVSEYQGGRLVVLGYVSADYLNCEEVNKNPGSDKFRNYLITPDSAGDIRLGMTVAEARKVFKNAKFDQYNYSEEGTWVEVTQGETELIRFTTDQTITVDDVGDDEGKVPIVESAKIEHIEFSDPRYKTVDGIHVGTTVDDVIRIFGQIAKIEMWDYDGSEHIWFANAPKSYGFTISPKKGSRNDTTAGVYGKNEYSTTKYRTGAYISSIRISKIEENELLNKEGAPKFEDYPVDEFYSGKNSPLVLDSFAISFRTRLNEALNYGTPTFAGKYVVAGWGCGTSGCNTGAVIDAKTGRAYPFPVSLSSVTNEDSEGEITDDQEHSYQLNSRLMIFAGNLEGSEHTDGNDVIEFYEFRDGKFNFIKSMPYGKAR